MVVCRTQKNIIKEVSRETVVYTKATKIERGGVSQNKSKIGIINEEERVISS